MCKYCKINKDGEGWNKLGTTKISGLKKTYSYLYLADGKELFLGLSFGGEEKETKIKINYCPMCGRSLKEENV